ncbi:hypothetical protein ACIBTP_41715 [Streptomyces avidinii]|uniref:hypothetical protein n=1 Tax=Streptomyces avidinii TaxID=1895 RepID=UPI003790AEB5
MERREASNGGDRAPICPAAAGPHWLRVVCAEAGTEGGTLWNGPSTSRTLPAAVPRPDLFRIRDRTTDGCAYRAELYAFAPDPMVSPRPVLNESPGPPPTATSTTATAPAARTSSTGKDGAAPRTAPTPPPCTCTPCPETAARIRAQPAPVLDRPEARTRLLTVCAQVLRAQDRIDFHAEFAAPVREHLAHL